MKRVARVCPCLSESPAERSRGAGLGERLGGGLQRVAAVAADPLVRDEVGHRHHPAGALHHARVTRLLVCRAAAGQGAGGGEVMAILVRSLTLSLSAMKAEPHTSFTSINVNDIQLRPVSGA